MATEKTSPDEISFFESGDQVTILFPNYCSERIAGLYLNYTMSLFTPCFPIIYNAKYNKKETGLPVYMIMNYNSMIAYTC